MANPTIEIALTFDDGPDGSPRGPAKQFNTTECILNVLRDRGIKAAFFVQTEVPGRMATADGKAIVAREYADGHVVGIQSGSAVDKLGHPEDTLLEADLKQAKMDLLGIAPGMVPKFVRGPFGRTTKKVEAVYAKQPEPDLQYVFWDIDGQEEFRRKNFYDAAICDSLASQVRGFADRVRKKPANLSLVARFWDSSFLTAAWLPRFLDAMVAGGLPYRPSNDLKDNIAVPVTFCATADAVRSALAACNRMPRPREPGHTEKAYSLIKRVSADDATRTAWHLILNEGWVRHLYLDSRGLPTIGVGHRVINESAYLALPVLKPHGSDEASPDKKKDEWARVLGFLAQPGFDPSRHTARFYLDPKSLLLSERLKRTSEVENIFLQDLTTHWTDVPKWVNDSAVYASLPSPVRIALLDMVYTLGLNKMANYVNLRAAVLVRDWARAAAECDRGGISNDRNAFTRWLFLTAAALDGSPGPKRYLKRASARFPARV
jgi:GH24 family phage-related lysozyme (muramidase)